MMVTKTFTLLAITTAFLIAALAAPARAQDFYKDKTLNFIVGYSPGGTYDQYTRLIARHISKYLPGRATAVVENMPGAGGIIAANHLYNRAKPDGLTIAHGRHRARFEHAPRTRAYE
jgi:tripartite-type tricarboxylate transporter receptor subunit TctC